MNRWSLLSGQTARTGSRARGVSLLAAAFAAVLLLTGCQSARRSSELKPPARVEESEAGQQPLTDVSKLPLEEASEFEFATKKRSNEVLDYYDQTLKAQGWQPRKPANQQEGGHRKWTAFPPDTGFSDALDAAWVNPKTGETAVLSLYHRTGKDDVQYGIYDVYPKGEDPWADLRE